MVKLIRSGLTLGVAAITAAALTIGPPAPQSADPAPPLRVATSQVALTATPAPLAVTDLPGLLTGWLTRVIVPPSASAPFPQPDFPPVVGGTSIDSTIKNIYNAVEPWVQYGFELATYAVGWVPYVGWLSPQIMIFYFFGERIARSITFNIADWLGGNISFITGLINVGIDTVNSFIQLGIDEWNFWLPPLPPLPPFFPFAAASVEENALIQENSDVADESADLTKRAALVGETAEDGTDDVATDELDETKLDETAGKDEPKLEPTKLEPTGTTTTNSLGTVRAQGEVRQSPLDAPPAVDPVKDPPSNTAPSDPSSQVVPTPPQADAAGDKAPVPAGDAPGKPDKPDKGDTGDKGDKGDAGS